MPPPPPTPVETPEDIASHLVTFRFLGLKTRKTRFLFVVDMNRYLGAHEPLVRKTVMRALDALHETYEFGIIGFQQLDSGSKYYRWPVDDELVYATTGNKQKAEQFLAGFAGRYRGASSVLHALQTGLTSTADALILVSDGLPNPAYNNGLSAKRIVREISVANLQNKEIHTVAIGDYTQNRGLVMFLQTLARQNGGDFVGVSR